MPRVSVIIPNYNHSDFLKQRIDSVLTQTVQDIEVILLDDCSSDNSKNILLSYSDQPRVSQVLFNETNSGSPFRQWSKGIRLAKAEFIWIAESDDYAKPDFLAKALENLADDKTSLFYSDSLVVDRNHKTLRKFSDWKNSYYKTERWSNDYHAKGSDEINNYLRFTNTINNSSAAVFRKKQALELAPRLEEFSYYGDWYLSLAIAANNDIAYSAIPLSQCRVHDDNLLGRPLDPVKQRRDYFLLLDLLYKMPELTDREDLLEFFALQYLNFGLLKEGLTIGPKIYKEWKQINKRLARRVIRKILSFKMTGKKPSPIY